MSPVVAALRRGREVAWASLRPTFDHALALAYEAEHEAHRAANLAQTSVTPAYPPLVLALADAGDS